MPTAWQRIFPSTQNAATVFTLATEIAAATVTVSDATADTPVTLMGVIVCTTGAGATTFTPRIRRGGVTGTLVSTAPAINTPASSVVVINIAAGENPGEVASQTYTLTGTAAGVAATAIYCQLIAIVG